MLQVGESEDARSAAGGESPDEGALADATLPSLPFLRYAALIRP